MSDTSDVMAYIGGGTGLVGGVIWLIKTLGGRVVQREDDDKKTLQAKLDESQRMMSTIEKTLIGMERDILALRGSLDSRAVAQDREIANLRADVKEDIKQLEHRLKQDMQRLIVLPRGRNKS